MKLFMNNKYHIVPILLIYRICTVVVGIKITLKKLKCKFFFLKSMFMNIQEKKIKFKCRDSYRKIIRRLSFFLYGYIRYANFLTTTCWHVVTCYNTCLLRNLFVFH